jgi:hypothetical protein
MALSVLAYNLTRAMNIVGIEPLINLMVARDPAPPGFRNRYPLRPFLHGQDPTRTFTAEAWQRAYNRY